MNTQDFSARRAEAVDQYPGLWKRMTFEWRAENDRDYAWLTYSANYLLRTAGIRWARSGLRPNGAVLPSAHVTPRNVRALVVGVAAGGTDSGRADPRRGAAGVGGAGGA